MGSKVKFKQQMCMKVLPSVNQSTLVVASWGDVHGC